MTATHLSSSARTCLEFSEASAISAPLRFASREAFPNFATGIGTTESPSKKFANLRTTKPLFERAAEESQKIAVGEIFSVLG